MNPLLFAILLGASAAARPARQAGVCGSETEMSRLAVVDLVSWPASDAARRRHGIPAMDSSAVHLLTTGNDAPTCARMLAGIRRWLAAPADHPSRGWIPVYYAAGDYYFAVMTLPPPPPGQIRLGFSPLLVFDRDFRLVASIAS